MFAGLNHLAHGTTAPSDEAYFNGQSLVVRPTKMYDFSHGNNEASKTFVRWLLGRPIGNTTDFSEAS